MKIRNIPEELFKSVYFRAEETKRPDAIIKDELAVRLIEKIASNFSKLDDWTIQIGIAIHTLLVDTKIFRSKAIPGGRFQWAINDCKELESWHPGITLIKE
jgi:O-methyltransferase involved in polyketide biosynthesis